MFGLWVFCRTMVSMGGTGGLARGSKGGRFALEFCVLFLSFFSFGVFFLVVYGLGIGVLVVCLLDYSGQRVLS